MDIKGVIKAHGYTLIDVADKMGITKGGISQIVNEYKKVGLDDFAKKKYGGNHRSMSEAERVV